MITIIKIREDLKEIKYYYSRKKLFDDASKVIVTSSLLNKVNCYNQVIKNAPAKLYDLYISLYTQNSSQETVAYDWGCSADYIKQVNKHLCEFFLKEFNN